MGKQWEQIADIVGFLASAGYKGIVAENFGAKPKRWGKNKRHWYVLKETTTKKGLYRWLIYGDWKSGHTEYYCQPPDGAGLPSKRVMADVQKEMESVIKQKKQQAELETRAIATKRIDLWPVAETPTGYLSRKNIEEILKYDRSLRLYKDKILIVPMTDNNGVIWGYQQISDDGSKYYLSQQRVQGTYHLIPGNGNTVFVCEGYATGASIRLATGSPVMVTFSTSNLKACVPVIQSRFKDKNIIVAADNDAFTNGNPGIAAATEVADRLNCIRIAPLFPSNAEGKPTDFNDYHVLYGLTALKTLITEEIESADQPDPDLYGYRVQHQRTEDEEKLSPKELAAAIVKDHAIKYDEFGTAYIYEMPIWRRVTDDELKRLSSEYDAREYDCERRRVETMKEIKNATFQRGIPWNNVKPCEIVAANGIYNLESEELRPHRAEDFIDKCPRYGIRIGEAECPLFLKCLDDWFLTDSPEDREEKKVALQMFFGYCLMPHARYKKAIICHGPPDTGKSLMAQVMEMILGKENCCSIPLEHMDCARKIEPIQGKLLNIVMEPSHNALFADGGFKRLVSSGDEMVTIDPKHRTPFRYHPTTKHAIFTNVIPGVADATDATFNRLLFVGFGRVFAPHEQDKDLIYKLQEEAEGIMSWAALGAWMLYTNDGRWPTVRTSDETLKEHKESQNVAMHFVEEYCKKAPLTQISVTKLYQAYIAQKLFKQIPRTAFITYLSNAGYEIKTAEIDGRKQKALVGYMLP